MPRTTFQEVERMSVIPPPEKFTRTSVSLPDALWAKLEKQRTRLNAQRDPSDRLTRDDLMRLCLEWADRELEAEAKPKRAGKCPTCGAALDKS